MMLDLWNDIPTDDFWGIYIGGDEMAGCGPSGTHYQSYLSAAYIQEITDGADGSWRLGMFWVGPQSPGEGWPNSIPTTSLQAAYDAGETQASDALTEVNALGIDIDDAPITYDLEPNVDVSYIQYIDQFIEGWDYWFSTGTPQLSGVYGNVNYSDLTAFATPPNYIWGGDFDGNSDTAIMDDDPPTGGGVPNGDWVKNQRLKQYDPATQDGLGVDLDSVDGPLIWAPVGS